ncbi:MAG: TIGR04076 family protein [Bacillota bacterium]
MYDLRVVVDEVRGFCDLPMRVGDYFEVKGGRVCIPPGKYVCLWALQSLMPILPVKQRKIAEENDWISHTSKISCPDPNGQVIFRVEVVPVGSSSQEETPSRGEQPPEDAVPARLLVDADACSGCLACEAACSFRRTGSFAPARSCVFVHKEEPGTDIPNVCRQCGTAPCVAGCPTGALYRDPETMAVLWDGDRCTRCGLCVQRCAFSAVRTDPVSGDPMFCDLCGGDPECVRVCPTGAITYGHGGSWTRASETRGEGHDRR